MILSGLKKDAKKQVNLFSFFLVNYISRDGTKLIKRQEMASEVRFVNENLLYKDVKVDNLPNLIHISQMFWCAVSLYIFTSCTGLSKSNNE